jgi:hypothetical protein
MFEAIAQSVEFIGAYSSVEEALQRLSAQVQPTVR